MTSTVHSTGRASPFVLTYVAGILPQSENLELKICAIHLHSSLAAMSGVFSRGTDKQGIARARFCRFDHCEYLIFAQAALLEFRLGARPLDKFRRVFRDDLAGLQEPEERANGGQLLRLR